MAFEQLVSKIFGLISAKPSGNAELTEQHLLALTKKCLERAQRLMTSPTASAKKFNFQQCMYLVDKLKMAVESADLLVERGYLSFPSQVDSANCLEVFKLLYALATEVENFTQICSKDAWIQAALTLSNVSEHISSIGFSLMLWSVHSSEIKQLRERRILSSTEVDGIFKAEVEVVEAKASVDRDTMSRELHDVLSNRKSSSSEYQLAVLLLGRLDKSWKVPGGDSAGSSQASLSESISRSLQQMESLGKGSAGTVYKAKWLGAEVAQKTFYVQNFPDFEKEVAILAGLSHPNVASLLYCDKDKRECSIVMELMDTDLFVLIRRRLRSNKTQEFPFGLLEAVDIMHQVGKGMRYLHEMKIVHRDLKSMNILVKCRLGTSDLEIGYVLAKVADFGMSKTKEKSVTFSNQTLNVGTSRWMAPETFKVYNSASQAEMSDGQAMVMKYPFKSDVYSFGLVCYEILTGEIPFSTTYSLRDVKKMVLDGVRPPLPYECPSLLKRLIERCWSDDPSKRPGFDEICKELRYLKYLYSNPFQQPRTGMYESGMSSPRYASGIRDNEATDDQDAQKDRVPHDSINSRPREGFDDFDEEVSFEGSQTPVYSKPGMGNSEVVRSPPQLPPLMEEPVSSSFDDNDSLPGIEGLRIVGDPVLGGRLTACGHPVNGTYLCIFQWIRQYRDGSANFIEGAVEPEYVITADDWNNIVAVECVPIDERNRRGELVKVMVNEGNEISRDPMMQDQIEAYMTNNSRALFEVTLLEGTSEDASDVATLILRRFTYELRRNNGRKTLVNEEYSSQVSINIPAGEYPHCFITCHDKREIYLELQDSRSRDLAVLTFRAFLKAAVDEQKKKMLRASSL